MSHLSRTADILKFKALVSRMYPIIHECASEGDDSATSLGLECLVDLALSPAPVLRNDLGPVAQFALSMAANQQQEIMLRDAAMQVVVSLCAEKPRSMVHLENGSFVQRSVECLFQICSESRGVEGLAK